MLEIGMAVVVHNHKILIAQRQRGRKQALLWEFPGGKIEPGETAADCIRREFMDWGYLLMSGISLWMSVILIRIRDAFI